MTNKDLQKHFKLLNECFFNNRLESIKVSFGEFEKDDSMDGVYDLGDRHIFLIAGLKEFPNFLTTVLLHEMAHADLDLRGYRGYPSDGGHGGAFQVELDRLYRAGAYEGLL